MFKNRKFSVVVLAAGKSTRMKSYLPKAMHKLSGKPLVKWCIDSVSVLKPDNVILVLGRGAETIEKSLSENNVEIVHQKEQLGSAHALMQSEKILKDYKGNILVMSVDVPLVRSSTLLSLVDNNMKTGASVTVLTAKVENPFGYGRIIKNSKALERIVEESDATLIEKQIKEVNSGVYCFDKHLWKALSKVKLNRVKKEYYLTDTVAIIKKLGKRASIIAVEDNCEIKGINNRAELAQAEDILKTRKISALMYSGVTIIDPKNIYISHDSKIGRDTVIYPGAFIDIGVSIGKSCTIKGTSYIANSKIGDKTTVSYSYIDGAIIHNRVEIGPFSHIRSGSILYRNVKIGNFSETKKSVIKKNSRVNHLSYIGDARVGEGVNIGAGTITCNYDGFEKRKTVIGSKSFVGSNVNFIAPVKIGRKALIAAGSTITHDVPPGKLAIARVHQEVKHRKMESK
jgi:bifunctional UDP-N-acetylglucosamine pyrophosphorylase/glucosamine-1-phosphate N-acetyltransferase